MADNQKGIPTNHMDVLLLDALLEQQLNGNKIDETFTSTTYNNVLKICEEKLNHLFDKDHLKNRIKTLKSHFNGCHDLFKGLSGFSWSLKTKLFEAKPKVWNALIEAKPNAKTWRHTQVQHYDKLYDLFAKDRATDEGTICAKKKVKRWEKEGKVKQWGKESHQFVDVDCNGEVTLNDSEQISPQSNSQIGSSSKGIKRKFSMMKSLDKHIEMMQYSIGGVADAIRDGNIAIRESNFIAEKRIGILERGRPCIYSEIEVYVELVHIGVLENLQLDAFYF